MKTTAVILAAGQGTRMKSKLPKVLHQVLGKPMVQWVLDCLDHAGVQHKIAVLGHGGEQVGQVIGQAGGNCLPEGAVGHWSCGDAGSAGITCGK